MHTERLQILLSPEQRRRLEAESKRRRTSVAALVREAIDERFGRITAEDRGRALGELQATHVPFMPLEELDRIAEAARGAEWDRFLPGSAR